MVDFNDINLAKSEDNWPPEKVNPGEKNTRIKSIALRYDIDSNLSIGDEILGETVPENAKILDAYVRIDGSLGTGGIVDFGLKAGNIYDEDSSEEDKLESYSEDQNALVSQVDAGGQGVFKRADVDSVFLGSMKYKVGKGGLQTFVKVTEAPTSADSTPRELEAVVFYSLEH